jgi:pilus assembly protein Flp/PilA
MARPGGDAALPVFVGRALFADAHPDAKAFNGSSTSLTGVSMKKAIQQFLRDEEGAAAIEYALLVGLISVMVIGGATLAGTSIQTIFTTISTALQTASGNTGTKV